MGAMYIKEKGREREKGKSENERGLVPRCFISRGSRRLGLARIYMRARLGV